jgi:ribosome biogenesis GTPase A
VKIHVGFGILPAENVNEREVPAHESVARLLLLFLHVEESVREFYTDSIRINERHQNQNIIKLWTARH